MHAAISRIPYALHRIARIIKPRLTVTPAPQGVVFERDVPVTVRDGTTLRVNVFRPATQGVYPVILCAHPYGKDDMPRPSLFGGFKVPLRFHLFRQPEPFSFSCWTSWEAPDPAFWVPRGYVVVNCDLRGFGTSDGTGTLLTHEESLDYFDLIEWAGVQPWSSGKVGLLGVSYLALSQYRVAQLKPPHLAAICPWEGFSDLYRDLAYPGGVREDGFMVLWSGQVVKAGRTQDNPRRLQMEHPLRDAAWERLTPDLEKIEVPMLVCASFSDQNLHTGGSFRAFMRAGSRRKWLFTHRGGKWSTFYGQEARTAQARFFDHVLKGLDNGMEHTPPVRLEVRESGSRVREVRHEADWPLPHTRWKRLHLGAQARLLDSPQAAPATAVAHLPHSDLSFAYTFREDTELTGPMSLSLRLGLDGAEDCCLFVGVSKTRDGRTIGFEGSYGFGLDRVANGWLRLSHRELDEGASSLGMPVHAHKRAMPVKAGEVVSVEIALLPSSTFFRKGEGLRLDIQGRKFEPRNPLIGQFPAGYEASPDCRATLHFGGESEAFLLVPVTGGGEERESDE